MYAVFKPIRNSHCSFGRWSPFVCNFRLRFHFEARSISIYFPFAHKTTPLEHTHTLSLTSPIFKWTRTGFSMLLGFHYVEAASEKLIKLLINRFCVKHKYELRRFFSLSLSFHSCYSTPAEYGKRSKNLGSFFFADFIIRDYSEL